MTCLTATKTQSTMNPLQIQMKDVRVDVDVDVEGVDDLLARHLRNQL